MPARPRDAGRRRCLCYAAGQRRAPARIGQLWRLRRQQRRRGGHPPERIEKQQCLLRAFAAGERVRLDVELPTVEGDPIYYRYTVVERGMVEVRTDTTHDAFGPRAITTERCTGLEVVNGYLTTDRCTAV